MKEKRTAKTSANSGTDWERFRAMTESQIQRGIAADPDIIPTDAEFWKTAKVVMPKTKQTVTIRLDAGLLE